jgi:hypothetical protein
MNICSIMSGQVIKERDLIDKIRLVIYQIHSLRRGTFLFYEKRFYNLLLVQGLYLINVVSLYHNR